MKLRRKYTRGGETVTITAERLDGDRWRLDVGERTLELRALPIGDGGLRLITDDKKSHVVFGVPAGKDYMVRVDGHTYTLSPPAARGAGAGGGSDGTIRAPMTGTVLDVLCREGDVVAAEQTLVVLSAMKMEHKLAAGIAGTVLAVAVAAGATVEQGCEIVVVEPRGRDGG
jgi:biotin carboxyl carrier protein